MQRLKFSGMEVERLFLDSLVRAAGEAGPVFVKIGQVLATRRDIIPPQVSQEQYRIGSGCVAQTYLGFFTQGGVRRKAAIKVLHPWAAERMRDDFELARFFVDTAYRFNPALDKMDLAETVALTGEPLLGRVWVLHLIELCAGAVSFFSPCGPFVFHVFSG
jgi:predicted unusual protein kinase regulating ubiquinone biosynthesis (AarF/ABC1/UbiB family)